MIRFGVRCLFVILLFAVIGLGGVSYTLKEFSKELPDVARLQNYQPPVVTRLHANDGQLIAEYAINKRVFVPLKSIPQHVVDAFISAEDQFFYTHPGIDLQGIMRAAVTNFENLGSGKRLQGASTITQQVSKNFFLTNEVSYIRKLKEMILSFRLEKVYSKQKILELYLNEIYLGFGSYGVASAALEYFNKSLDELTVGEAAYLAALPKAPGNYHPIRRKKAGIERRNWVLNRMLEDGNITTEQMMTAREEDLKVIRRKEVAFVNADFFAEEVRRELLERFGEKGLYEGGLTVKTTLDPKMQQMAKDSLIWGLRSYDRRHGWRGPIARMDTKAGWPSKDWLERFREVKDPIGLHEWKLAVVLRVTDQAAFIGFKDGKTGQIPLKLMKWAGKYKSVDVKGPPPKRPGNVVQPGDVIAAAEVTEDRKGKPFPANTYELHQIPEVQGGMVVMDPHTGRVLAMVGGYAEFSKDVNEYNRATQAQRQPGSAFKPFVYLTALNNGCTPSTIVYDGPVVIDQGPGLPAWKPKNYGGKFYGPSTLRLGIEKSRNLMTVRLAQAVGMPKVSQTAKTFGVVDAMAPHLAMSLGSAETTVVRMSRAYSMLVNGGKNVRITLFDRVQDRTGKTVFKHDNRPCEGCRPGPWNGQNVPKIPDTRQQIADARSVYQVVSMLQGVVQRGTGITVASVGKPLAGKTGTTNDSLDAWFMGFSPDLVAGVWVGFDQPRTLGRREAGSRSAAPIFREFMKVALKGKPATPFRIPRGVYLMKVDKITGRPPGDGGLVGGDGEYTEESGKIITEVFKTGNDPYTQSTSCGTIGAMDGELAGGGAGGTPSGAGSGTPAAGGVY